MLPAATLVAILEALAKADVGHAAADAAADEAAEADAMFRAAHQRLKDNPDLLSGDPDGLYTFEDPVLAILAHEARTKWTDNDVVGHAEAAGDNLRNLHPSAESIWDYTKLAVKAVLAWKRRGNLAWELLGPRGRADVVPIASAPWRLALVGDAGGRGAAQTRVFGLMKERHDQAPFHHIIHLGDTYFGTSEEEMLYNLLEPLLAFRDAQTSTYSLCGNHDLYYGPQPYHAALTILGQPGRYFCLESPEWRVVCLDTSLAAERLSGIQGKLDDQPGGQLEWLDALLAKNDGKQMVLLSHHCILSGWDREPSPHLADQLRERVRDRIFAWYWGHEHRCATFGRAPHGYYGACVGNGVWMQRRTPPPFGDPANVTLTTWYPDALARCNCYKSDGPAYWPHGFLELELNSGGLVETFHLEDGSRWRRNLMVANPHATEVVRWTAP